MNKNVKEVISHFESLYSNKSIYLWGCNSEIITKELCDKLYKTYGSSTYNKTYYDNKLKEGRGKIGADCSGAFYPVSGFDTTAQGYYNKCSSKGNISSINRNKPCLVFKGKSTSSINHIGFYLGNGYVIEMKSSKENCVKDVLDANGWKWFGIPTWINYSSTIENNNSLIIKAVDVSSYQGNINWNLVKSVGVDNAILKVIRKDLNPDKKFEQNWNNCKSANMNVQGVYNYSYATTVEKAKTDAQKVLSILNGRKCTIWLDVEDNCQKNLGKMLVDIINAYRDVVVSAGYDFGVYTSMSFFNSYLKPYKSQIKCDNWWIARYYNGYNKMNISVNPNEQYNPKNSTGLDLYGWQYTSSGQVGGINGNVDLNIIYKDVYESSATTLSTSLNTNNTTETSIELIGRVTTQSSNLTIRKEPNTASAKLGSYKKGAIVRLLSKTSNGWYRTKDGYVFGNYISNAIGKVSNCFKLNMRNEPKVATGNVVKILLSNTELYLLKEVDGWYKVRTKDNVVGYVSKKYVTIL